MKEKRWKKERKLGFKYQIRFQQAWTTTTIALAPRNRALWLAVAHVIYQGRASIGL